MTDQEVAPFAGAWIETARGACITTCTRSLPSRERGLKPPEAVHRRPGADVAPFAGAWIETRIRP